MLAGGTGITPMIQALHAILDNTNEAPPKQRVTLFYGSQTSDDILGFD
jgi:cytochrome-b5 reductase